MAERALPRPASRERRSRAPMQVYCPPHLRKRPEAPPESTPSGTTESSAPAAPRSDPCDRAPGQSKGQAPNKVGETFSESSQKTRTPADNPPAQRPSLLPDDLAELWGSNIRTLLSSSGVALDTELGVSALLQLLGFAYEALGSPNPGGDRVWQAISLADDSQAIRDSFGALVDVCLALLTATQQEAETVISSPEEEAVALAHCVWRETLAVPLPDEDARSRIVDSPLHEKETSEVSVREWLAQKLERFGVQAPEQAEYIVGIVRTSDEEESLPAVQRQLEDLELSPQQAFDLSWALLRRCQAEEECRSREGRTLGACQRERTRGYDAMPPLENTAENSPAKKQPKRRGRKLDNKELQHWFASASATSSHDPPARDQPSMATMYDWREDWPSAYDDNGWYSYSEYDRGSNLLDPTDSRDDRTAERIGVLRQGPGSSSGVVADRADVHGSYAPSRGRPKTSAAVARRIILHYCGAKSRFATRTAKD
mmetsp:Transcript_7046/g.25956  ORF Transcript_7046/g.25956 Transcript_7046/m.25956 type:complete len:485 (+) Transcript_7046:175-1629(+)